VKRSVTLAIAAVGVGALAALGGCEIVAVGALNLIETTRFTVEGETLYMSGEINSKTDEQFAAVIAANPQITTIVECDVPGSLDDDTMIPLSYQVRALGLNTHLTGNSEIASGGVDFFLAGVERTMEAGARIGVHSWSDGSRDAKDYPRDSPEHEANREYVADMLGDDAFYWFTIYAAPADDIYWMRPDEVAEYGMLTVPVMRDSTYDCPSEP
jgi:beta-lactamase class D